MAPFIGFIHSGECCVMRQVSGCSLTSLEVSVSHVIQISRILTLSCISGFLRKLVFKMLRWGNSVLEIFSDTRV